MQTNNLSSFLHYLPLCHKQKLLVFCLRLTIDIRILTQLKIINL